MSAGGPPAARRRPGALPAHLAASLLLAVHLAPLVHAAPAAPGATPGAAVACEPHPAAAPALARLRAALAHDRFITYQPTGLTVTDGRVHDADVAGIRADLAALRPKFDALVTYDAVHGAGEIPGIAAALGFRALVIGVWNPADDAELDAALEAARRYPQLVVGISLGNESLFARRTDPAALTALVARARARLPGVPLTTTEPFHLFLEPALAPLVARLDFLAINVHPVFQPWFRDAPDAAGVQFVVNVVADVAAHACGPVLVKETGLPSAPASAGYTEARQAAFYAGLRRALPPGETRAFAYFAAFDAPWRAFDATGVPGERPAVHEAEAHWGLYDAGRRPKAAARELPPLR